MLNDVYMQRVAKSGLAQETHVRDLFRIACFVHGTDIVYIERIVAHTQERGGLFEFFPVIRCFLHPLAVHAAYIIICHPVKVLVHLHFQHAPELRGAPGKRQRVHGCSADRQDYPAGAVFEGLLTAQHPTDGHGNVGNDRCVRVGMQTKNGFPDQHGKHDCRGGSVFLHKGHERIGRQAETIFMNRAMRIGDDFRNMVRLGLLFSFRHFKVR